MLICVDLFCRLLLWRQIGLIDAIFVCNVTVIKINVNADFTENRFLHKFVHDILQMLLFWSSNTFTYVLYTFIYVFL